MVKSVTKVIRLAGLLALVSIGVLSVLPGEVRPHVVVSGHLEHFGAYCVAGFIIGFGYFGRLPLLSAAIGLPIYSGVLEAAQLFIPGRNSRLSDVWASSLVAWAGIILVFVIYSMLRGREFMRNAQ